MNQDWEELRQSWRAQTPPHRSEDFKMQHVLTEVKKFDFGIRWRNRVRWVALAGMLAISGLLLSAPGSYFGMTAAVLIALSAVGQAVQLWRLGGAAPDAAPESTVREFRASLAEKFDRQIRYLRQSRAVGALAMGGVLLWSSAGLWAKIQMDGSLARRALVLAVIAALFLYVGVVRYRHDLRKLAEQRDELLETFGGEGMEE